MSCDLKPTRRPGPHYQGDVFDVLDYPWDLVIAHPPCTHTAVSGAAHFAAKRMDGRQHAGVAFFLRLWRGAAHIPMACFEQPVSVISSLWRKPDQIIQPYEFGDDASKATCLYLRGLRPLTPTGYVEPRIVDGRPRWSNQCDSGQNRLGPSDERASIRAETYPGIAAAMASQWGHGKQAEQENSHENNS
jgi:hypothetical protein